MQLTREDHDMVRRYVTAKDEEHYAHLPEDVVAIIVTHSNLPSEFLDLRFDLHLTIEDVKERLRKHFGTPVNYQRLILQTPDRQTIGEMSDNSKMLGFYSVKSGYYVHLIDEDPFSLSRNGGLTDTTLVEKYRMDDGEYDKRKGTVREQIRLQKALKQATGNVEVDPALLAEFGPDSVAHITNFDAAGGINARCEVSPGGRRGFVRWVGESAYLKGGLWVGVQFDEPVGRSDGTLNGERIFECERAYGGFVRGKNVAVGDFPERDVFADDDAPQSVCCGDDGDEI